ncbi:MAG: hypothetical protein CL610_24095 [Anaerolineaceae bacterium]|nr:hypothetical protein [Anaerolineaceae bacterium]
MLDAVELAIVDDNPGDVLFCQEFFKQYKFSNNVSYLDSHEQLLDYLEHPATIPDVVMLSIRPFLLNGCQSLKSLKHNPIFENTLLVGLTATDGEEEVLRDEMSLFAGYLTKPLEFDKLRAMLVRISSLGMVIIKQEMAAV